MPPAKFRAYLTMLPRLQAEEQLATVNALFATEGRSMKDGDQSRFLERMERIAMGQMKENRPPASPGAWEAMGIRVHLEPGPKRRRPVEKGGESPG